MFQDYLLFVFFLDPRSKREQRVRFKEIFQLLLSHGPGTRGWFYSRCPSPLDQTGRNSISCRNKTTSLSPQGNLKEIKNGINSSSGNPPSKNHMLSSLFHENCFQKHKLNAPGIVLLFHGIWLQDAGQPGGGGRVGGRWGVVGAWPGRWREWALHPVLDKPAVWRRNPGHLGQGMEPTGKASEGMVTALACVGWSRFRWADRGWGTWVIIWGLTRATHVLRTE